MPRKETWYLFYRTLVGCWSPSGWVWKISSSLGFDAQTIQPVASCYTDCGIVVYSNQTGTLPCKLNTLKKRVRKVIIEVS